ncbi:MAG: glutamate racemase [Anaerolineae bacterium]|nr:glutamate racemase [Anaerolineae bacterium]
MSHRGLFEGFVGVFDSGVGGLSVWREIARQLPHEGVLYLADQAHVPYGSRSLQEVCGFSEGITRFLLERGAKIVVVACNAASAAALHHLRKLFPDTPIVGMEPALKPAVERTKTGVVGVLATQAAFQGELFASLMDRYAHDVRVVTQVGVGLVEAVEAGAWDLRETELLLMECLEPLVMAGADQLVLGCTHYPFLRPAIERIVEGRMVVIDPAAAVARQTARVLARLGLGADQQRVGDHVFCTSGDVAHFAVILERVILSSALQGGCEVRAVRWRNGRVEFVGE